MSKKSGGAKHKGKSKPGRLVVVQNRRARHDYAISDTLEAGLALTGSEVKSVRNGDVQINEAFVLIRHGQAALHNCYIGDYKNAAAFGHEPRRVRRLLLNNAEIERMHDRVQRKGDSLIPLELYFKNGWLKLELGIGKGKSNIDRRESIKERDTKREMDRAMRRSR